MLIQFYPKIGECNFIKALRSFYRSWVYIAVIALLMAVSELFSAELAVFYCYLFLCTVGFLVTDDALVLLPIAVCSYTTISAKNNPGMFPEASVFASPSFKIQFVIILGIAAVLVLARLVTFLWKADRRRAPSQWIGFLVLGAAYVLCGVGSEFYDKKTALFGLVQIVSLCAYYFYFYYAVDWKNTPKSYIFSVMTWLGIGLAAEIVGMYFINDGAFVDGAVHRDDLFTGWGNYNNVGCAAAMCLPAPFYFSVKEKHGWLFTVLGGFFLLSVFLTQSRGSIFFSFVLFLICILLVVVRTHGMERLLHLIVFELMFLAMLGVLVYTKQNPGELLENIFQREFFDDNGRFEIYEEGMKQFREHPWFGVGFYQCPAFRWGNLPADSFLPPRYHDTYVQLLASGGVMAFCCYFVHRIFTLRVILFSPTTEKTFCALCMLALLLTSIVDCHFFNFGPALLYSALLVSAECSDPRDKIKRPKKILQEEHA